MYKWCQSDGGALFRWDPFKGPGPKPKPNQTKHSFVGCTTLTDQIPREGKPMSDWLTRHTALGEVSAMRRLRFVGPFPRRLKGWTAETSTRAAKPETQIDGHRYAARIHEG